jgi:deoxyinosine 3'endonuclease (endonuclease V)
MLLALDVAYFPTHGHAVALAFPAWAAAEAAAVYQTALSPVAEYEPGAFYKRELPCLLAVLAQVPLAEVSCLIVDGYVSLGPENRPGLGQHLHAALGGRIPVVGVAKTRFAGVAPQVAPVLRGESRNPLYVSSVGLPVADAARHVAAMHGPYRLPTLLKQLDDLTKQGG